jgi:protein SYS1
MPARRRPPRSGALTDLPPLKIVRKIVLLQLAFYGCATVLILFTTLVLGTAFSPNLILGWDHVRGDTTVGWMLGLVWLSNSFFW